MIKVKISKKLRQFCPVIIDLKGKNSLIEAIENILECLVDHAGARQMDHAIVG